MDIMDPFSSELLSAPPLPGAFSGWGATHHKTEFDDDYLRAIGALPRRPCAPASPSGNTRAIVRVPRRPRDPARHRGVRATAGSSPKEARRSCHERRRLKERRQAADIDFNLREKERNAKQRPSPDYLKNIQGDRMDERTRTSLVVWMGEFARHFHLAPGTVHRAVSYVDRVLSARTLSGDNELRLLGAAAVFTAAKCEERSTILKLNAAGVAWYCGFATSKEVTDTEREMLATLRYELGRPTAYTFVDHFTRNSRGEKNMEIRRLAHQLADTSLLDYGCLRFMPSAVAATALLLARRILNPAGSQEYFEELTGYKPTDLVDGMRSLFRANSNSRFVILPALSQYL